jgi:Ca2+/Na+ antiporter
MSDFISDDEWDEILSAGSALERADKVVRIAVRSVGALIFLGIGLSVIGLVWFAHHAADDSFQQMLAVSLASGLALYLAVAGVLAFGHKYRWMLRILLLVFAAVCGYFSYRTHGLNREWLIEACAGLLLTVVLELTLNQVREYLAELMKTVH